MLNNSDKWRLTLDVIWPKGSVIFNALTYFLKFLHFRQFSIINHSFHITAQPDQLHFNDKTSTLTNYSYVKNPLPFAIFTAETTENSISLLSLVNSSSHINSKTIAEVPGWILNFKSHNINENNPFDPGILSSQFLISKIAWSATSNSESTLRSLPISISDQLIESQPKLMQINSEKYWITLDSAGVKDSVVSKALTCVSRFLHLEQFTAIKNSLNKLESIASNAFWWAPCISKSWKWKELQLVNFGILSILDRKTCRKITLLTTGNLCSYRHTSESLSLHFWVKLSWQLFWSLVYCLSCQPSIFFSNQNQLGQSATTSHI